MTLSMLEPGTSAMIQSVDAKPAMTRRLSSMGFVPGATVTVLRIKTGARHVRIGTTEWALSDKTAEMIRLRHV